MVSTSSPAKAVSQGFARETGAGWRRLFERSRVAIYAGLLLSWLPANAEAQDQAFTTFDLNTDPHFAGYARTLQDYVRRTRPATDNDFCVLGFIADDHSRMAWVLWRQGNRILLWEGNSERLDRTRRTLNLKTDVVPQEEDLKGSSYLVTKLWVENLGRTCNEKGVRVHLGANGSIRRQ